MDFPFIWFGAFLEKKSHQWKRSYVHTLAHLTGKHLHWYIVCGRKPWIHIHHLRKWAPKASCGKEVEVRGLLWLQQVRWQLLSYSVIFLLTNFLALSFCLQFHLKAANLKPPLGFNDPGFSFSDTIVRIVLVVLSLGTN